MSEHRQMRQTVVIPRPVDYFEIGAFAICALYGVLTLPWYQQLAATSLKAYPGGGGIIFLVLLVAGGATGLISYRFKTIKGPKLELAGLTLLVVLCIAYTVWTPIAVGVRGIGLILFMGVLIAIPGFFTRKRLIRYIHQLESIESSQGLGGEESGASAKDTAGMGDRIFRRRRNG